MEYSNLVGQTIVGLQSGKFDHGHSHCTSALACTEVSVPCKSEGYLYW
jgi:hypothetical protein